MNVQETMLKITFLFPDATIGEDNDGQVIIYTNCKLVDDCFIDMDDSEEIK